VVGVGLSSRGSRDSGSHHDDGCPFKLFRGSGSVVLVLAGGYVLVTGGQLGVVREAKAARAAVR
jgi:hypothetical protein